ncbi:hypothetical protein [Eikenella sp. Marseille-P7795]|uniref:hypothetical protein n=1 Tax=Eikenella sp. Marseille-P7795 TaxID=2866577 RepID=UPI001CE3FC16|nr:hypothetical protein [Eikenella sp. Marseille-P7795]
MFALNRTLPAFLAATALLLAGCDKIADKIDETQARQEFVTSCAKSANESSKGAINLDAATKLCGCSYDEAASTYSDRNQWKRDLVRYGLKQDDKALEAKLEAAMNTCVERFTKGQL